MTEICEDCGEESAIVGWGAPPPVWIGLACLNKRLDQARDHVDQLLATTPKEHRR